MSMSFETMTGDLTLTVRGGGVPAKFFTAGRGDLDKLTVKVAEYVYSQSQPAAVGYLPDCGWP